MTKQSHSIISGHVRVTFEFPSSIWASKIHVSGCFNLWSKTATPLKQERDGMWRATLDLPANQQYEYHFLVDGMPQNISQADQSAGQHRSFNSILWTTLTPQPNEPPLKELT